MTQQSQTQMFTIFFTHGLKVHTFVHLVTFMNVTVS